MLQGRDPQGARRGGLLPATLDSGVFLGWKEADPDDPLFGGRLGERLGHVASPLAYSGDAPLMTIAPTGAGKGVSVIIPALLTYPGSVIVTDIKGENFQVTARYRRQLGQQVVALDPFGLLGPTTDALNPFDLFDLPGADCESDAEMLSAQLSVGHDFATDRYWNDTGTGLVSGLISYLATAKHEQRKPSGLRAMLHHDDLDYTLAVLLDTKAHGTQLARDEFVAYLAAPSDRTRPCIRSTACTYVKCLGSAAVIRSLDESTMSLLDLMEGKPMTIYLVMPPEKLSSHAAVLRLWVATLLTAVVRRRAIPRRRTLFLMDEAAQLGPMDLFRQAVTLLRGYGLQMWSFWQDLSQLRQLYPKDWETMVNNAAVLQTFGAGGHGARGDWQAVLGSRHKELAHLGADEMLVSVAGEGVERHTRANYLYDHAFSGRFDPNKRYANLADR